MKCCKLKPSNVDVLNFFFFFKKTESVWLFSLILPNKIIPNLGVFLLCLLLMISSTFFFALEQLKDAFGFW